MISQSQTDIRGTNFSRKRPLKSLKHCFIDAGMPPNNVFDYKKHSGEVWTTESYSLRRYVKIISGTKKGSENPHRNPFRNPDRKSVPKSWRNSPYGWPLYWPPHSEPDPFQFQKKSFWWSTWPIIWCFDLIWSSRHVFSTFTCKIKCFGELNTNELVKMDQNILKTLKCI